MTDFRDQIRDLPDAIGELIRSRLLDVHVALPAQVTESFDPARCSVTVRPLLKRAIPSNDGRYVEEPLPEIYDVPVLFPAFGGFQMTFPIAVGDVVTLIFPDYDPGAYRVVGAETGPGDTRRHGFSGACALPCSMLPLSSSLASFNTSAIEFGRASGFRVACTSTQLRVGGASDSAALASKVDALASAFNAHVADYNLHKHPGVTAGAGTSAVGDTPSSTYGGGASASSVLKVSS